MSVQSLQKLEDALLEPSFFKPGAFRRESNEKQPKSKVKKQICPRGPRCARVNSITLELTKIQGLRILKA